MDHNMLIKALTFAQSKHKGQNQKGIENAPIINHVIEVTGIIRMHCKSPDLNLFSAALLHDTLEKSDTSHDDLKNIFSPSIADLVLEVSDDPKLSETERKNKQIETASKLSIDAASIRIADKIQNIQFLSSTEKLDWSQEKKFEYFEWAEAVVRNCTENDSLKALFKDEHRWARLKI